MARLDDNRVALALSGGVDSAVAAHLLAREGRRVSAIYLEMGNPPVPGQDPAPADSAAGIASRLGLDFRIVDARASFDAVIEKFADEYASGRTPNPCGLCNRICKFRLLAEAADAMGAAWIATGHHVVKLPPDARGIIARSPQAAKDQTYALFNVQAAVLQRCLFPLAALGDKATVRRMAGQLGLAVAERRDSQDMCFAPDGDYEGILRRLRPEALTPGDIVDAAGRVLGRHRGVGLYTLGQRRGLGVAASEPLYVTAIDPAANTVRLGPRAGVLGEGLTARQVNWHAELPPGEHRLGVQVRYAHRAAPAVVTVAPDGESFTARFDAPVHAITPGQAAVLYEGETLLGGGWIERAG